MTRPTQPGTRVLDFRAEKPKKQGHDLGDVTSYEYPPPTMSGALFPYPTVPVIDPRFELQIGTHELSEAESREISPQGMKRPTRKRKAPARFQQSPTRPIHRNARQNSVVKSRKQLKPTVDQIQQESQKLPSDIDLQYDLLGSEESNGELRSEPQAKKRPGRQPGQSLSYGKRLTEEEEIILMKCCLANCVTYGQAGKITEWWTQIKEDFC